MIRAFVFSLGVLASSSAIAQQNQCRTSPVGASTPYCASEAFVTETAAAAGGVTTAGPGLALTGGGTTLGLSAGRQTLPTIQTFLSGSGNYTTPPNVLWIEVYLCGGASSGANSGTSGISQNSGAASTFSTFTASGGVGRIGGAAAGGSINVAGQNGSVQLGGTALQPPGANGGGSAFYGGGGQGLGGSAGEAPVPNSGGGGAGGGGNATVNTGTGGGAGGCVYGVINSPAATLAYTVGAGGALVAAGPSGFAGSAGSTGRITVIEHYGS